MIRLALLWVLLVVAAIAVAGLLALDCRTFALAVAVGFPLALLVWR
jgi:hypothetical protein